MGNLLVVDFDFFFPNPFECDDPSILRDGDSIWNYDWGHKEDPFMVGPIWEVRALTFAAGDVIPLPGVNDQWRGFADRFALSEDATLFVADSNAHAGLLEDPETDDGVFDNLVLFDAHHDLGYGVASLADWEAKHVAGPKVQFSCEDWALLHYRRGTKVTYVSPPWHTLYRNEDPKVPAGVDLRHLVDDGTMAVTDASGDPLEFSTVFVCRSGAWVPPWCDRDFAAFVDSWPAALVEQMDDEDLDRGWSHTDDDLRALGAQHRALIEAARPKP